MKHISKNMLKNNGFTIVELLIVVVVIAILAAITIVAYNGISSRAKEATLKSDLQSAAKQLQVAKQTSDAYPANTSGLKKADSTTLQYTVDNTAATFCLTATSPSLPGKSFFITQTGSLQEGSCPSGAPIDGALMQTITTANCPTTRIRAVDARDNHTYWVQKLGDGKCWMLTNLGYAGGGANTYNDVRPLTDGTGGSATFTSGRYYVVPNTTNFTTEPTSPSTATNGTGQFGYLYNWCAAMGAQTSTSACADATSPLPNTSISVCPAGWRLPANSTEFSALNTAVNGGATNTDAGLRTNWLAQQSGYWINSFDAQNNSSYYWYSSQFSSQGGDLAFFFGSSVFAAEYANKSFGNAVRCMAN